MILQKAYKNQNFSKEKYQLGNYCLIQFQILQTNITLIVRQTVRKITNEILGVIANFFLHYRVVPRIN